MNFTTIKNKQNSELCDKFLSLSGPLARADDSTTCQLVGRIPWDMNVKCLARGWAHREGPGSNKAAAAGTTVTAHGQSQLT